MSAIERFHWIPVTKFLINIHFIYRATQHRPDPALLTKHVLAIVGVIYMGAVLVSFPNSYYSRVGGGQCYPHWPHQGWLFIYYVVFMSVSLIIPLATAAVMYICLAINVRSSSNRHNHSYSRQRRSEDKLLYKTMLCTVFIFGILTSPYAIFIIIYMNLLTFDMRSYIKHANMLMLLNYIIFTLAMTNSSVNPLIYAYRGTKKLFSLKSSRSSQYCMSRRGDSSLPSNLVLASSRASESWSGEEVLV